MNWEGKKVFVTGAGGFIGSHLCEKLVLLGCKVTSFVHYNSRNDWGLLEHLPSEIKTNIEVISGNIQDPYFLDNSVRNKDIVFHLAALIPIPYSYKAPLSYIKTNVEGTLNIMEASLKNRVEKVVHTSTSEVYGTAQYVPIDEKHPLQGQSPYSASKIGADKIAESYFRSFSLPVITIRPFNTYGPRQSARAVIPTIISQVLNSKNIFLGSLEPKRDFTYIDDTVEGFIKIAQSKNCDGEVINIGSNIEISIGDLANKIISIIGRQVKIESEDKRKRPPKSEVERLICDNKKVKELLGWEPHVSLEEGLIKTIEWVKKSTDLYKTGIYNV
ncbi:MAG: GDP-mannose 4,6-dehydratase [Bacteroidetes bacterium]|nr:GDP-mannose 4,6-dehydratase [Bacteroidota bacterium]